MSKHTPGPWILSETEVLRYGEKTPSKICEILCSNNNKVICEIPDYRYHAEYDVSDMADARLLATAPELIEALVYARRFLNEQMHDTAYIDSVIAKAKGNQP